MQIGTRVVALPVHNVHHIVTMTALREARKARGETVAQVAKAVGTDRSNLSRIERGQNAPLRDLARALYRYFEGDVDPVDVYDPTFRDEVGVVIQSGNSWYRIETRNDVFTAHGREELATVFDRLANGES